MGTEENLNAGSKLFFEGPSICLQGWCGGTGWYCVMNCVSFANSFGGLHPPPLHLLFSAYASNRNTRRYIIIITINNIVFI